MIVRGCKSISLFSNVFWRRYPALYFALAFLLGVASYFHLYFLLLTFLIPKRSLWALPLIGLIYCKILFPAFPGEGKGEALFHIEEVKRHSGPFHTSLVYRGKLRSFRTQDRYYHRIPCRLYLSPNQERPPANCDYILSEAELIETAPYSYLIKSKEPWIPVKNSFSWAEWRFQTKQRVKKWVASRYKEKRVRDLISALATGNLENRLLAFQFGRVGLQHLLAISGFHFALLTLFLAYTLKRLLSEKMMALALIFLLTLYFFYMGGAPSISRAWIGVVIYFIGIFFSYRPSPLNALGVALLIALLSDPLILIHIGFQLSFGATLGILLFYKPFEGRLQTLFPKRSYLTLKQMPYLDQGGYLLCSYLRKVIALNGAVLTFTLPLLLYHFHTFPLLSLFYNLFFPFLFSLMMAGIFVPGSEVYASFLIDLIAHAPKRLMFEWGVKEWLGIGCIIFAMKMWGRYLKRA